MKEVIVDGQKLTKKEIESLKALLEYGFDAIVEDLTESEEEEFRQLFEKVNF